MQKQTTAICLDCSKDTKHTVLYQRTRKEFIDEEEEINKYMVVQCGGCGRISFLLRTTSAFIVGDDGKPAILDSMFPPNFDFEEYTFLSEEDQEMLPDNLYRLYDEIKSAFKAEASVLAGIGLRTLIEAACLEQNISGNNLVEKIKNLHAAGLISTSELPILDKLRLIGNASAHQIKALSIDKLSYALDIINHVLKSIYVLPKINKKLKL